ncbi:hypothetical protein [Gilvimarinus algae]|uniref:Energy-coupling factor ABC transporter permease n=1 Tax=Gilvimarinus algae TaxID=3058037 RepID=A0ABT8TA53_9GAMM|nr:hypothetical protein [Gilvimarinus sp. SDUM040014]MDO3380826.1 hypothetical protein [Gilvimarinus sp. SDUM040014]
MHFLTAPSPALLWVSIALALPLLVVALRLAPWSQLLASGTRQHAFYASVLALGLFWLLQVEVREVLGFHPMLMAVTTMVFGAPLALIVGALALAANLIYRFAMGAALDGAAVAFSEVNLAALPVSFLLGVAVPVGWTWLVIFLVDRWRFKNPFTYFLGVGFFGAMLSCLWLGAASYLLFFITGSDGALAVWQQNALLFVLMMFPEGFCNGAIATVLTVLWPDMVKTYRDDWYLGDK